MTSEGALRLPSLPAGWCWTSVESLGASGEQSVLTGPFGSNLGRKDFIDVGIPVLTIGCLTKNGISLGKAMFISREKASELVRYKLAEGDVLFSRMATVGRAGFVDARFAGAIFNYHIMRLRLSGGVIDSRLFIYYVHGAGVVRQYVRSVNHGVTRDGINTKQLLGMPVCVPPILEQRRIVAAIESYFTRLDDAVATMERAQRNLKRYRASVLKAAVEGRLVPTEAELAKQEGRDYEPASVLLERILVERRQRWEDSELAKMKAKGKEPKNDKWKAKYKEPAPPEVDALPDLPEGWCYASVGQLLENHDGKRVPIKRADRAQRRGQYPYYGASGVIDSIDDFLFDGDYLLVGEDGANLLSRSTPIAFQANGQFWVNNHAHVFQTLCDLPLAFFETAFNATNLAPFVTGTAQPKLPQAAMNQIPFALPPETEMHRIVAETERSLTIASAILQSTSTDRDRVRRLRQSILKWAFEGKLVDQDPDDEPASVLLERIKAERELAEAAKPKRKTRRKKAKA